MPEASFEKMVGGEWNVTKHLAEFRNKLPFNR